MMKRLCTLTAILSATVLLGACETDDNGRGPVVAGPSGSGTPLAPAPAAPAVTVTNGTETVTVTAVGPQDWSYTATTTGGTNIRKVSFNLTVPGCSISQKPQGWTDRPIPGGGGIEILSSSGGALTVSTTVTCDAVNGPIYVYLQKGVGGAAVALGPVAGPV